MDINNIPPLLLAGLACFAITTFVVVFGWLCTVMFVLPRMPESLSTRLFIGYSMWLIVWTALSGFFVVPAAIWSAALTFVATVRSNLFYIFALTIVCTGGYVWLDYHPTIISNYLFFRQSARPVFDLFLLPVVNILRIIFDAGIPVVNFWTNLYAFYEYGLPITLFKCGMSVELANLFSYGSDWLYAIFYDFNVFFLGDFFHDEWNIMGSLHTFGLFAEAWTPLGDCLCLALTFLWNYFATFLQLPSLHNTINCAFNWFISLVQLAFNLIMDLPAYPNFTNVTQYACCAIESAGDTFEDWVFLTGETAFGVLTNTPNLPPAIAGVLSVRYTQIITHPLCGLVKLGNMTANLIIHFPEVFASDGSGVKYFQFGTIADELRVGVLALGALTGAVYGIFDDSTSGVQAVHAFTSQLGLSIVDILAFVGEWLPGNIFYFQFGGDDFPASWNQYAVFPPFGFPSNFIRYYFVDYYLKAPPLGVPVTVGAYTYSSSLSQFFTDIFLTDQALANLLGLINDPFGQVVRFVFDAFWALMKSGSNFVSFIYCILTFQCDALPITFRNVDFDVFFLQLYFLAGAAGDMIRQFDEGGCVVTVTEDQKNIVCCAGALVESTIDTIVAAVQQITHFVQDLLTLPTFQIHLCMYGLFNATNATQCVRIPDFGLSLYQLNTALCDFTCALMGIIPTTSVLQCVFTPLPPPASGRPKQVPPQCAKAQTCIANEICALLQLFTVPLQIANAFFVKIINGQTFTGFIDFLVFSFNLILGQIALIIDRFGYMIDCLVCSFAGTHINCSPILFQVLNALTTLIRATSKIFTELLLNFIKLVLGLIIGMFGGGNPIKSLVDFIVGFLTDIFGGIGSTVIDFLVSLFDAVGLGFVGAFLKILWQGFCPLLQILLNVFIGVINLITFGAFNYKQANFCCSGGNCTLSGGVKRDDEQPDFTLYLNSSYWIAQLLQGAEQQNTTLWQPDDPCATTVPILAQFDWHTLSSDQQGEMEFCLFRKHWLLRTDGQYSIGNSTCDEMVLRYQDYAYQQIDDLKRFTIRECIQSRLMMEGLRTMTNQSWIPQDLLTEPWRKWYMLSDFARGYVINWQYMSDQQKSTQIILSAEYQQYWATLGLSVAHYAAVQTSEQVDAMRATHRLRDYFTANGASQYEGVVYTATSFWSILSRVAASLKNVTVAMTDNQTDPAVYLSYSYSLGNQIPTASQSLMAIMGNMAELFSTFTSYWADESHYKKREEGYAQAQLALQLAYNETQRQIKLMSEEFWTASVHASQLRANQCGADGGACDPAERQAAHEEYVRSTQGQDTLRGETSAIYKLSQWWSRASFRTYTIKNPRYGTNRSTYGNNAATLQYRHKNGTLINETARQRFWRTVDAVSEGTPASQKRWATLGQIWHKMKASAYKQVLRNYYDPAHLEEVKRSVKGDAHDPDAGKTVLRSRRPSPMAHEIVCDAQRRCTVRMPESWRPKVEAAATAGGAPQQQEPIDWSNAVRSAEFTSLLYRTADIFDIVCYTNITINCVPPLVCNGTNTTTLCEQCLYLDQLIGRVTAATNQLIAHYTGGRFAQSVNLTVAFFNYCFDTNARVIVGDSPQNSVREFPRRGTGNFIDLLTVNRPYVSDPDPGMGFSDIQAAIDQALNTTNVTNFTLVMSTSDNVIDNVVTWFITTVFFWAVPFITTLYQLFATDALFIGGEAVFSFVIDWFLLCDWLVGDDYSGANKRFSIGETLCMYVFTTLVVTYISTVVFGVNVVSIVTGTSLSLIIFFYTFLSVYSNWAALCAPGLPVILMDDTTYFLAYTAFPKCSWFWGFQIKQEYTNENCYPPRVWQCWHCRKEVGFETFIDNLVFVLQQHFPGALEWLRTTRTPFYVIYQIPWVNEKVNKFVGINLDDPVVAATYYGCNWITTITLNFLNATYAFIIFYMLGYPITMAGLAIGAWLFNWLLPIFLVLFYMFLDLVLIIGSSPYDRIPPVPEEQMVHTSSPAQAYSFGGRYDDDDDNNDDDDKKKRRAMPPRAAVTIATRGATPMRYTTKRNPLGLNTLRNITGRLLDQWSERKTK